MNVITGEKIQQLCDIYLGSKEDFDYNPIISQQKSKHFYLNEINEDYNNPYIIFCYGHNINLLSNKIHFFTNNFILFTHNSDGIIYPESNVYTILNYEKVLKWYGQNICFEHPKLNLLPIGLANSQWQHGNLSLFINTDFMKNIKKSNKVYFNFNISTNINKRGICYENLFNKLEWLNNINPLDNLKRLSSYEFCICPEGNGVDTHRLWECLYLKVVPIVVESNFTTILLKNNIPLFVLEKWDDLDINNLNYNNFSFDNDNFKKYIDFNNIIEIFNYNNSQNNIFDIVIPIGPDDIDIIEHQIEYTRTNIIGYRNIYLITRDKSLEIYGCITIQEELFPFSIQTIDKYIHNANNKNGWFLQQLLKLYAGFIIPNILEKYLVIDADTFFLKPTTFYKNGKCLYNYGREYFINYFNHMKRLDNTFIKVYPDKSGICHHMMFEKKYIKEIFEIVEKNHNDVFYKIFLKNVKNLEHSGASEYEIYFNYINSRHKNNIELRLLKWKNVSELILNDAEYDYISYHSYLR